MGSGLHTGEDTGENQGTFTTPAWRGRDHGGLPRSVFTSSQIELTDFPWSSSGLLGISSYNPFPDSISRPPMLLFASSCCQPPGLLFHSTPLSPPDHVPRFLESTSQPRPLQPQLLLLRHLLPRYLIPQVSRTVTAPSQEPGCSSPRHPHARVFQAWTGRERAGGTRGTPAGTQRSDRLECPPHPGSCARGSLTE